MRGTAAAFGILVGLLCATAAPASAATPTTVAPATKRVQIKPTQIWTPTGILLKPGENVTITATGVTRFGTRPIDRMPPAGLPRGPQCIQAKAQAGQRSGNGSWPAPKLNCWSLIGKIGSFPPF
jgi:hypothetical protein